MPPQQPTAELSRRKEPKPTSKCNHQRRESNFLRKERNRVQIERTLTSSVHTLVSGKKAISDGKNMNAETQQEIEELSEKLEELLKTTRMADNQEQIVSIDKTKCSGHCKTVVRKIVEQVRAETEQWSQMKQMLVQVHGEMEQLQVSRDFWENQASESEYEVQTLKHDVDEWQKKALAYEINANELQLELSQCQFELQMSQLELQCTAMKKKDNQDCEGKVSNFENADKELKTEAEKEGTSGQNLLPISLGKQLAKERRMLIWSLEKQRNGKEKSQNEEVPLQNTVVSDQNSEPLRCIGNSIS